MNHKTFLLTAGGIFSLIALLHILRLIFRWEAIIAGWVVPPWLSWVAMFIAGYLSYGGLRLCRKAH